MTELARGSRLTGTVRAFDSSAGLGTVTTADGDEYHFHCVEIADGTREVAVGATVSFDVMAKFGRYEAANVGP